MDDVVGVIADVVGSRRLADRAGVQRDILAAFAAASHTVQPARAPWATFADEFQAIYRSVADACAATTLMRLSLAEGIDMRFGLGEGLSEEVTPETTGSVLDGTAWWRARSAIGEAERRGARSGLRSWAALAEINIATERHVNAALLMRDDIISSMTMRERRITHALVLGATQKDVAATEGISQAAVSQAAKKSGAQTIVQVFSLWRS